MKLRKLKLDGRDEYGGRSQSFGVFATAPCAEIIPFETMVFDIDLAILNTRSHEVFAHKMEASKFQEGSHA